MRRLSWRSVPITQSPPAASAFFLASSTSASARASFLGVGLGVGLLADLLGHAHLDIAAELNVGAAAGHVGGDRHRAGPPACATMKASCSW
jgi:hypothetical protein